MPEYDDPMGRDFLVLDAAHIEGKPHGWIQHKGSNLCIDLYCTCGAHHHYDGDFLYRWICPTCQRHYTTGSHLVMWEMTSEEVATAKEKGYDFKHIPEGNQ